MHVLRRLILFLLAVLLPPVARAQLAAPFPDFPPAGADDALPLGIPLPEGSPLLHVPPSRRAAVPRDAATIAAPDLVYVPAATFTMGNPYSHLHEGFASELPLHEVTLSPFLMARTEVPNALAAALLQSAYDRGLVAIATSNDIPHSVVSLESTNPVPLVYLQGVSTNVLISTNVHISFSSETSSFSIREGKDNFPAFYVTWYGALSMANFLSDALGLPRTVDPYDWSVALDVPGFRIPTDAEWERAARGDLSDYPTHYPWPNDSVHGDELYPYSIDPWKANYTDYRYLFLDENNILQFTRHPRHPWFGEVFRTTPVAWYNGHQTLANTNYIPSEYVGADYAQTNDMANALGLYDMAGNVTEWCVDYIHDYTDAPVTNPCATVPSYSISRTASNRVFRGGAWDHRNLMWDGYDPSILRCAYRVSFLPNTARPINGFRLVRALSPYETWAAGHFSSPLSPEAAPDADPDIDRFPNASEFAACTDPTNSASRLAVTAFDVSGLSFTFPAVSGLVYSVEAAAPSADPAWKSVGTVTSPATGPMTLPLPSNSASFVRIAIP